MANSADKFTEDYDALRTAMKTVGLLPDSSNYAKFSTTVNNVNVNVAARIATQKPLYKIGETTYQDDIYQYQVWAEKNGTTLTSICGGGKGNLDVNGIKNAVTELLNKYKD
jgi:hypothetical protein